MAVSGGSWRAQRLSPRIVALSRAIASVVITHQDALKIDSLKEHEEKEMVMSQNGEMVTSQGQRDLAWRVGGPQGSGVDTAANLFARACAMGGLRLFGRREYYSNIMGRHSYFDVRVAPFKLTSHREHVDFLATFGAEALTRHAVNVVPGGGLLYNADTADTPLQDMPFLDDRLRNDLTAYLQERNLPATTDGLLEDARNRNVRTFAVPYVDLIKELAARLSIPQGIADRTLNTLAVAVSTALLGYDATYLKQALHGIFGGRERIIKINEPAIDLAYEYVEKTFGADAFPLKLTPVGKTEKRLLMGASQASALGKMAAGLTFQTYYPISPATDESVFLEANERFRDIDGNEIAVTVVQTEDELSAMTMATGAALTGARSSTATSGPGFALMAEALGWAGINEVPVVLTIYQRGGPSTGLPTRTEQGDLLFAVRAGHGEFPRLVVASGDVEETFYDAAQCFNYAERYQTPVIHLLDKALASTTESIAPFDVSAVKIERGQIYTPPANGETPPTPFPRFEPTETGISTRPFMGQPGGMHWVTGGEHTLHGRVTEDPVIREQQMEKRARKLETALKEIPVDEQFKVYGDPESPFTILSWGSNKGAILEAIERLKEDGISARLIQVRLLWPFPAPNLEKVLANASKVIVVEYNFSGQFAQLLRENTGRAADHLVVKFNGRPISGNELYRTLKQIHAGEASQRIVLRNPFE